MAKTRVIDDFVEFLHDKFARPERERWPHWRKVSLGLLIGWAAWMFVVGFTITGVAMGIDGHFAWLYIPWTVVAWLWGWFGVWHEAKYIES